MSNRYLVRHAQRLATPTQQEPLNERSVPNNAGGFGFALDAKSQLDRFLILGSEGGSYYVTEQKLTADNIKALKIRLAEDGIGTVNQIVEISVKGRAPKNDPALFALAYAASKGDDVTRSYALNQLSKVARTGTHLFQFVTFAKQFRGFGRGLRAAIASWYQDKKVSDLALQVTKYQQRDGWSHRDLFRLTHPKFEHRAFRAIAKWIVKGEDSYSLPERIVGHNLLQTATSPANAATLIRKYGLTRESVPTQFLTEAKVWEALLEDMPLTALIRNLGNLSKCGLLTPLSSAEKDVLGRLGDYEALRKARVHPIQVLLAMLTYKQGHGVRGHGEWRVCPLVVGALDAAFDKAFQNVEPTGKNFYLGVDVSGSMTYGNIASAPGLTPNMGAAAMAMVTARSEKNYYIAGFSDRLVEIPVTARDNLESVCRKFQRSYGATDCAVAIKDATTRNMKVDAFVIYTDGETWAGEVHAAQALERYRQKSGVNAKLIVCGMVSNQVTVADPKDAGSLNVIGFDTATPQIIAEFVKN